MDVAPANRTYYVLDNANRYSLINYLYMNYSKCGINGKNSSIKVAHAQYVKDNLKLSYLIYTRQALNSPTHAARTVISNICTFDFCIVFEYLSDQFNSFLL